MSGEADKDPAPVETREEAEVVARTDAEELRARAARVRERSEELIEALGEDHPLVMHALARADSLERQADAPGHIHLR